MLGDKLHVHEYDDDAHLEKDDESEDDLVGQN